MKKTILISVIIFLSITTYSQGFYKKVVNKDGKYIMADSTKYDLIRANNVYNKAYSLKKDKHKDHTYPIDGWYWYENESKAIKGMGFIINKLSINYIQTSKRNSNKIKKSGGGEIILK